MSLSYKFGPLHEFQDQVPTVRPPPPADETRSSVDEPEPSWGDTKVPHLLVDLDTFLFEDCTLEEAFVATHIDGRLSIRELSEFTGLPRDTFRKAVARLHALDLIDLR